MIENLLTRLSNETNFVRYIELLAKYVARKYTIVVAANDTPCGSSNFTPDEAIKLMQVGFTIPLFNKWRCSYAAILDAGKLVFEGISQTHTVSCEHRLDGMDVRVESSCFGVTGGVRDCKIIINGNNYAANRRGLAFVVFDKTMGVLIDSVTFDTYSTDIICRRPGESPAVKDFKARHPGVTFISPIYPEFPKSDLSQNEKFIVENNIHYSIIKANADILRTALNGYLNNPDDIREVLSTPTTYVGTDGARHFFDYSGKHLNTVNGHRITTDQPDNAKRAVYTVGGCNILGIGARDCGTLASQLQSILNNQAPEHGFIVENYGYALDGINDNDENEITAILESIPLEPGDIVVGYGGIPTDSSKFNKRPHDFGELFYDDRHITENCHRLVALAVFDTMKQFNFFIDTLKLAESKKMPVPSKHIGHIDYGLRPEQLEMLEAYKSSLSHFYEQRFGSVETPPKIGAIVMNCNPFTLGHKCLIEQCATKVDFLIVFVVQEDKSFFPFEDRIRLVEKGTENLPNVGVVKSGNFIISRLTFKEYFNKSELQDIVIDSSTDVTIFACEIAPAAHITVRFAGSEPFDKVTKQYNDTLAKILPRYGIAFEEIPRFEQDGVAISASRVRALLEKQDWSAIERLVPLTTLDYLRNFVLRDMNNIKGTV